MDVVSITSSLDSLNLSDFAGVYSGTEFHAWVNPSRVALWLGTDYEEHALQNLKDFDFAVPEPMAPESKLQPLFVNRLEKMVELAKPSGCSFVVQDTHSKPTLRPHPRANPSLKPDVAFLATAVAPMEAAHFVTVGEFKAGNGLFEHDNRSQVFSYCQRLMTVEQPGRREVASFLLNTAFIQFVRVERLSPQGGHHAGQLKYSYTDHQPLLRNPQEPSEVPTGLLWLYYFLTAGVRGLGFESVNNPIKKYPHSTLLGEGVSSKVYAVHDKPSLVLKIFRKTDDAPREAAMLKKLKEWEIEHVPCLEAEDPRSTMALVLSPRSQDFRLSQFTLRHALQTLKTLKKLHDHNYVHRDIRPANLLLDGNDVLVNDWGFAVSIEGEHPYSGAFVHASDRVLEHFAAGAKGSFDFKPADDLVSLVRTVFVFVFPQVAEKLHEIIQKRPRFSPQAAQELQGTWKKVMPLAWSSKLQDKAVEGDYQGLESGLKELLPQL